MSSAEKECREIEERLVGVQRLAVLNLRDRLIRSVRDCTDVEAPEYLRIAAEHQLAEVSTLLADRPDNDEIVDAKMLTADAVWEAVQAYLETRRRELRRRAKGE